ncbi:MAG: VOC family protein [Alphaproteobacteria bacterium]|nr:VOC family protein [Alphaproteobacteria bacterium]
MSAIGKFVWYELLTTERAAAEKFYGPVIGWRFAPSGMPMDYSFIEAAGKGIGGVMSQGAGAPPRWKGVVGVADVDGAAQCAEALGGRIVEPPQDIPGGFGRIATLADPGGAEFAVYANPSAPGSMEAAQRPGAPGFGGWHELNSDDPMGALEFYSGLFGWRPDQAIEMGEMGTYQIFAIDGAPAGGIMKRPPQLPLVCWFYYFNVDGIRAAMQRVAAAGGKVVMGPQQVPGGSWILIGQDPQGAAFALVSGEE